VEGGYFNKKNLIFAIGLRIRTADIDRSRIPDWVLAILANGYTIYNNIL
jgi:hypothetical protein